MTRYFIAYAFTMVVFFAIDFVWLSRVASTFYRDQIGSILLDDFRMGWAAGFYLLYGIGIIVFAVKPGLDSGNILVAAGFGALFGAMCYGTYDFTNLATLKAYTIPVTFTDWIWGTVLTGFSAMAGCWLTLKFWS